MRFGGCISVCFFLVSRVLIAFIALRPERKAFSLSTAHSLSLTLFCRIDDEARINTTAAYCRHCMIHIRTTLRATLFAAIKEVRNVFQRMTRPKHFLPLSAAVKRPL